MRRFIQLNEKVFGQEDREVWVSAEAIQFMRPSQSGGTVLVFSEGLNLSVSEPIAKIRGMLGAVE